MKCVNHPDAEAEVLCVLCKTPVCPECRVTLRGADYCRPCLEGKVAATGGTVSGEKSVFLAFLLSLIPGVGYMYLEMMDRGLQTLIIFFGTIFVAAMTGLGPLTALVIPVLMFYSIFDTLQLARKMREGVPVEDRPLVDLGKHNKWRDYLGYALIVLGAVALLNNYLPYVFRYGTVHRLISPLLIIGVGVLILYQNLKGRKDDGGEGNG
ncbi:MAG: B-box zinc finger protein [Bacillota bacterium]